MWHDEERYIEFKMIIYEEVRQWLPLGKIYAAKGLPDTLLINYPKAKGKRETNKNVDGLGE